MTTWQRWQLWRLGLESDIIFCSISKWQSRFADWFPGTQVVHLPVGSNIERVELSRRDARRALGISEELFIVGLFGSGFTKGMHHFVAASLNAFAEQDEKIRTMYIGKRGADLGRIASSANVLDLGILSSPAVSTCFTAMDLYLAPFPDGVSTRRGSAMVALQHGVPCLSTQGHLTDNIFIENDGVAISLVDTSSPLTYASRALELYSSTQYRMNLGIAGRALYEAEFDWSASASKMVARLRAY